MSLHLPNLDPYEYVITLTTVSILVSVADMVDWLQLFILIVTAIGTVVKVIEQCHKSKQALTDTWNRIKKLIGRG